MFKYTSHTYVHTIKEKRLYMQVKCSHGKCLGKRQAKAQRRFCGFPGPWFPCSPNQQHLGQHGPAPSFPGGCLPTLPTTSLTGTGQTGTLGGRTLANQPSMHKRRGILLPPSRGPSGCPGPRHCCLPPGAQPQASRCWRAAPGPLGFAT